MQSAIPRWKTILECRRFMCAAALGLLWVFGVAQAVLAQDGTNPLNLFKNYFVTGDYVVAGWVEGSPDGSGYAPGTISVPDTRQPSQNGVPATVPKGADIVAAYLYWATVEGNQSAFAGKQAFFNGYSITGTVLGNPNAPVSWSSGGCSGSAQGSTTMRTYRADVRPYLPLDTDFSSPTFGATLANGSFPVRLADSGSNGNAAPNALGATVVIVYRVLSPKVPLNGIVIYDGAFAPSNTSQNTSQTMLGFYQPAASPVAKLTHIVANGQSNKSQLVYLNSQSQPLPSLYGTLPPFPGIYGSWDNPTWVLSQYGYVSTNDTLEVTSVVPSASNSGCVSWGAMILSTTVQDTDGDGLLDAWEESQGYTDANSGQFVPLPGANKSTKDMFVEIDYLTNMDGSAGPYLHSHLPKQAALDSVAHTLEVQGIKVHFDLGPNVYPSSPHVIQSGTGGNAISEGLLVCTDGANRPLCAYPGQSTIGWKGGLLFARDSATMPNTNPPAPLGNFQPGRGQSYHYVLSGHALGASRYFWSTLASALSSPSLNISHLVSIVNSGTTATVTLKSPPGLVKPGDCPNAGLPACSDANHNRVTITGAVGQLALNGTYLFSSAVSNTSNNVTTTTFTITTANVANGTYSFSNEPQLAVNYLGPTSTSGHSDFGGGGDSALTFGRWEADDPANCEPDPSKALASGQAYCSNQVGSAKVQEGTLLHELGHTVTLTHGGTYYNDPINPSVPTYEPNCKSNFLSVMNYLFQVRGFADDGGYDYSGQTLPSLSEGALNETFGIGAAAPHFTRWYAPPNALDNALQNSGGGRYATVHCDGTPITNGAQMVRVEGTTLGAPIDWNNNQIVPDLSQPVVWQDVNFNGSTAPSPDEPFKGFNDSQAIDLAQIGARAGAFGFSGGGGGFLTQGGGGFLTQGGGGFLTQGGGGFLTQGGGGFLTQGGGGFLTQGGGGFLTQGGGIEQDSDMANSIADPPTGLALVQSGHNVVLTWAAPGFGQVRRYDIWRALGSFPTRDLVVKNYTLFTIIKTLSGAPPSTSYTDTNVKNNKTYTYFVTETNKQGIQSGVPDPQTILVKY